MQSHEAGPSPDPIPPEPAAPAAASVGPAAPRPAAAAGWPMALTAALLAGVAAWLVGEATLGYFKPPLSISERYDRGFAALNQAQAKANGENGAVAFGALGGLLGLALGLAGGLSRRSVGAALAGAFVGLTLGAAAGALPAFVIAPWQWHHRSDDPDNAQLLMPLMLHAGLWCGLGAAAGLAYGLGRAGAKPGPLVAATLGGLVGAAAGTVVYEVVGALGFSLSETTNPISSTSSTRLLARLCVAGFTAAGVVLSLQAARGRPEKAAPAPTVLE